MHQKLSIPDITVTQDEARRHSTVHNGGKHDRRTMWITLLIIARASCEWVEISQNHYRKPVKTHQEYANQTIGPQTWTDRNVGITRVEASSIRNKYGMEADRYTFTHDVTTDVRNKEFLGIVEKVPTVGIVRRVQLSNTPVKSSTVMETTSASDQLYTNFEISLESDSEELPRRVHNKRKQHTIANEFHTQDTKVTFKNYTLVNDDESDHFVTLNTKITNEDINNFRSKGKINKINRNEYEKETNIATETTTPQKPNKNSRNPYFVQSEYIINGQNFNPNIGKLGPDIQKGDDSLTTNIKDEKGNKENATAEETPSMNNKANTMEVLMKLMKTVTETISKNSHKSLRSKMRYLHELKTTMLDNIENRIDMLWPDDDKDPEYGGKRRTRSAYDSARGHVEFPSSESTLMTISFLTFAVFLIKLVLQVIQSYKNKTMMVAPLVVATAGRAAVQRLRTHDNKNN